MSTRQLVEPVVPSSGHTRDQSRESALQTLVERFYSFFATRGLITLPDANIGSTRRLADVLALAGENPDAIREGVRVAFVDCEAIFRVQETNKGIGASETL